MNSVERIDLRRLRTVWLSDTHLGFRGSSAGFLLDFLNAISCERIYLVGDIIDIWALQRRFYWPDAHNEVLHRLLEMTHETFINS